MSSNLTRNSPFVSLSNLLSDIEPDQSTIDLSVGEPRHAVPEFVGKVLAENIADFRRYPAIDGTSDFRNSVCNWLDKRYNLNGLINASNGIIPLNGSREGLFYVALVAKFNPLKNISNPAILIPNPFYLVYDAAVCAANCETILLDGTNDNNFLPDFNNIEPETLERTIAVYIASPANPQGTVASLTYWQDLITLSRKYKFYIFADECYSEIYRKFPPCGILEAARSLDGNLAGIISFNSLSKRSNLAGLRVGFAAGDPIFLEQCIQFRSLSAPQVSMPLQAVAALAFNDENHVEENRRLYNAKFSLFADKISQLCDYSPPPGGFFVWLDVSKWGSDVEITRKLWKNTGIRVVPGSFLAISHTDGSNPGTNFIRIALVDSVDVTTEAVDRLVACLNSINK